MNPKSVSTPWGQSDFVDVIAPGITFYGTSSHGGFLLSPERLAEMPACLRKRSTGYCPANWFEEDCEAALVILAFPQFFPERAGATGCDWEGIRAIVKSVYPAQYADLVRHEAAATVHAGEA